MICTWNCFDAPGQPFSVGVTDIVATYGEPDTFSGAVHAPILPVPEDDNPTNVSVFVHEKLAPEGTLVKLTGPAVTLEQEIKSGIESTDGLGTIVTVASTGVPEQPLTEGVIVYTTVSTANILPVST